MKIKVAVLRGGPSFAYDESLRSGAFVLKELYDNEQYEPLDVFISRDGLWHFRGLAEEPQKILTHSDVVWNTMRGPYGEDGEVQKIMEKLGVPFVGSKAFPSGVANNKVLAKDIYLKNSIQTPQFVVFGNADIDNEKKFVHVYRNFMYPVIVKPASAARGLGVRLAYTLDQLKEAVKKLSSHSSKVIVEEYVSGTAVTCHVLEGGKGESLYTFVPTYIKTKSRNTRPKVEENKKMEELARRAHAALGLRHYSNSDFVITPRGNIYMLETNTVPNFQESALFHQALANSGWKPREFIDHSIKLALNN